MDCGERKRKIKGVDAIYADSRVMLRSISARMIVRVENRRRRMGKTVWLAIRKF
jgi:hypothetical protein